MKQTFYSNGKLLITSEYLVLDGAVALALPTKFGQDLVMDDGLNNEISWTSYDDDKSSWFDAIVTFEEIKNKILDNNTIKNTLIEILHEGFLLNPNFITNSQGYKVTTNLTFPRNWGLGTSSTLINNIAQWLEIDAFELLKNSFGGSGYDIACAQNDTAILYQLQSEKPVIKPVDFIPSFKENIYFVYLNQKQNSRIAIENYRSKKSDLEIYIKEITTLTHEICTAQNINFFSEILEKHELILSGILELKPVKEVLFPDFNETVKSLGAWGGDFVMVVSNENPKDYFKSKGFEVVLTYEEMIL